MTDIDGDSAAHATTLLWNGYQYTRAYASTIKTTFRCSYYRRTACKAKLHLVAGGTQEENGIDHTCGRRVTVQPTVAPEPGADPIEDISEAMRTETDVLAIQYHALQPSRIWEMVRDQFRSRAITRGLTRDQVISRVYRTRQRHYGSTVHGQIEVPPMSQTRRGDAPFFQFHFSYIESGQLQRLIGWGHPVLIRLLTYNQTSLFIDGTFRCVPHPFYQCLVVMVHDRGSQCYVPAMYVLSTSKTEWAYWHAFHFVKVATRMDLDPATVTCDFEQAIINAVGDQFPDATMVGCLFHFKQAVRRKMIKLLIPTEEVSVAMGRDMLDLLTIMPHELLDPRGIDHVTEKIQARLAELGVNYSAELWGAFWAYFRRTWLTLYPPHLWNVRGIQRRIVNRTNNPLERYNRELNSDFPNHRPSIPFFVGVIERHAQQYVDLLQDIGRGRATAPPHGTYYVARDFSL